MKNHIGAYYEYGFDNKLIGSATNEKGILQAQALLHGEESVLYADLCYRGITHTKKRFKTSTPSGLVNWHDDL